jgi:hypothetical protein
MKKGDTIDESHYKQEEKDEDSELQIMLDKFVENNSIVYKRLSKL